MIAERYENLVFKPDFDIDRAERGPDLWGQQVTGDSKPLTLGQAMRSAISGISILAARAHVMGVDLTTEVICRGSGARGGVSEMIIPGRMVMRGMACFYDFKRL